MAQRCMRQRMQGNAPGERNGRTCLPGSSVMLEEPCEAKKQEWSERANDLRTTLPSQPEWPFLEIGFGLNLSFLPSYYSTHPQTKSSQNVHRRESTYVTVGVETLFLLPPSPLDSMKVFREPLPWRRDDWGLVENTKRVPDRASPPHGRPTDTTRPRILPGPSPT